jgi:hypothetical protein
LHVTFPKIPAENTEFIGDTGFERRSVDTAETGAGRTCRSDVVIGKFGTGIADAPGMV